jgi:hypothetical protein
MTEDPSKKFPKLYNWYKNNPTFRVYENSSDGSYPHVGSKSALGVGSYSALGVAPDSIPGKTVKLSELLAKSKRKNPSYNKPSLKNPSKTEESFTLSGSGNGDKIINQEAADFIATKLGSWSKRNK